jgi:hypothetical protein
MSAERELLKELITKDMVQYYYPKLVKNVEAILAQPEQEPVAWMLIDKETGARIPKSYKPEHGVNKDRWELYPLYTPPPEQEPVAWIDYESLKSLQESTGYALRFLTNDTESLKNTDVPLYLAPPKREQKPLTPQQISVGNQSMLNVTRDAFVNGVKWAEKAHGIGGGNE